VAYSLGIYLLNLFLAFISPKFDPSIEQDEGMEDGTAGELPTKEEEFRPFVRRLPEFKFWYSATKAVVIGFVCSFFKVFDLPVFWPVLVVYWLILFALTSEFWMHARRVMRLMLTVSIVRRQIQHMIKYRYVPFTVGKARYSGK
jgi:Rer1 family